MQVGPQSPDDTYFAAGLLAQCATLAANDGNLAQSERKQESERFASKAMELLRAAIASGFKDADRLHKDEDLDVLRSRQDFQELLTQLKTKPDPQKK